MTPLSANIVVVDDDEASLYLKSHILRGAGYQVFEAASGAKALAEIELRHPEMVVLDVKLPDMNGLDICRQLKARDGALLILQTSATFVRGQDRAIGLDSGADAYLVEPVERDELLATVNALLRMRKAESELRRLNETLELRVAERTSELAEANQQLLAEVEARHKAEEALVQAQKMEAIGQLTGGVAHDFNNLLAIMIFNIEALQRRLPEDQARLRRFADSAMQGAQQAATLIRRLLAFSRRQPLAPKPIDINKLVGRMSDMLRRTLGERIAIEAVLGNDSWAVSVDANELQNALLNLAVNARDAMPEGGKLTIETSNCDLDRAYALANLDVEPGEYTLLAVADTGAGMTKEVMTRAFEPFFTTKETGQGTGLGLSQVYGFAKQSGGHVKIQSALGQGTVVKLYLPRWTGPVEEPAVAEPEGESAEPSGQTVLVVEDDPDVRASTLEMLSDLGYRTLEAGDGAVALEILAKKPETGILFTDVGLPGTLNGRQLADEAKQLYPDLKILFTTGYTRDDIVRQGKLNPGIELIAKPFTYAALAAKLREMQGE